MIYLKLKIRKFFHNIINNSNNVQNIHVNNNNPRPEEDYISNSSVNVQASIDVDMIGNDEKCKSINAK